MEKLIELCQNATLSHDVLIPLLPEEEQDKQNEWFSSIEEYSHTFKERVEKWLNEPKEQPSVLPKEEGETSNG